MAERPTSTIDQVQVSEAIANTQLPEEVSKWLTGETNSLVQIINVYASDPETYGLHQDLRTNPLLILDTMLQSAELLYGYQLAYNKSLAELAQANGIETDDLSSIPQKLQEISLKRERKRIAGNLRVGNKIAIGLMGTGASGKGTIAKRSGLERAVNVTTRFKRPGEEQGKDYFYVREMEPKVAQTLDIDTGLNVVKQDSLSGETQYELDDNGQPINYFEKYGPYVTTVHRSGRAKHGTPISEFKKLFDQGERTIFFEHGPIQVQEAGEELPKLMSDAIVVPVCILPPGTGILALASRLVVRTYGDPDHQDPNVTDRYKITEKYLESTIGTGQIDELSWTANFIKGENPLGIAYVVNDKLNDAVDALKSLINPQ